MRAYLYVRAERRLVLDELAGLPATGAILAFHGRQYRVTAVHAGQRPALLSLEACTHQPPPAT